MDQKKILFLKFVKKLDFIAPTFYNHVTLKHCSRTSLETWLGECIFQIKIWNIICYNDPA